MSFHPRSFHVADGPLGAREVAVATVLSAADARVLSDALSWQRQTDYYAAAVESADQILVLRQVVALMDLLDLLPEGGPITLHAAQVRILAEAASRYVAVRDIDGHQPLPERERITRLKNLQGPLFDTVADLAGAEAELAEQSRH